MGPQFTDDLFVPSSDGPTGNAVQVLNPVIGALGANVFAGSEPDLLSVSATGRYLYAVWDGSSAVQQLVLPTLAPGVKIGLGNGTTAPTTQGDLQASPAAALALVTALGARVSASTGATSTRMPSA